MWPILLCSVIAVAIILERFYLFSKLDPPNLPSQIKKLLSADKPREAERLCRNSRGPLSRILAAGIYARGEPSEKKEKIITTAGSKELRKLEKNLSGLGIIGHIAPLLGLLGTVTGMIKAFITIEELGGRVDASVLAGGIWEALITTAFGLSVAIPAIVFYHYFEGRVDNIAAQMKDAASEILE